jgi:hypothetical protein
MGSEAGLMSLGNLYLLGYAPWMLRDPLPDARLMSLGSLSLPDYTPWQLMNPLPDARLLHAVCLGVAVISGYAQAC